MQYQFVQIKNSLTCHPLHHQLPTSLFVLLSPNPSSSFFQPLSHHPHEHKSHPHAPIGWQLAGKHPATPDLSQDIFGISLGYKSSSLIPLQQLLYDGGPDLPSITLPPPLFIKLVLEIATRQ